MPILDPSKARRKDYTWGPIMLSITQGLSMFSIREKYKLKLLPLKSGGHCQIVIFKNLETWFILSKPVAKIYWTQKWRSKPNDKSYKTLRNRAIQLQSPGVVFLRQKKKIASQLDKNCNCTAWALININVKQKYSTLDNSSSGGPVRHDSILTL